MYNFQIIKYYNVNSDIHNMNPFYKIICILIFTALVLMMTNPILLLLLLLFVLALMSLSKVPYKLYLKNVKFIVPLVIFIIIINLIYNVSIILTINSILKLLLFVLYAAILIYTTEPNDITYGLEKLFSPLKIFKINVNSLALSISLAIRFIPVILEQSEKVLKSQISRGLDFNGSLKEKCNKLISILFPIFVLSFKRSDDISNTLDLKFYDVNNKRTKYKNYKVKEIDESILFMHVLLIFIYVVVEVFL